MEGGKGVGQVRTADAVGERELGELKLLRPEGGIHLIVHGAFRIRSAGRPDESDA